jgi:hypothetical protein
MILTPTFFSALIVAVIIIGLALAAVRLYADFSRPLPPERPPRPPYPPLERPDIAQSNRTQQNGDNQYGDQE